MAIAGASVSTAFASGWLRDSTEPALVAERPLVTNSSVPLNPVPTRVSARSVPMTRSVPIRLRIPAIGVDSPLMALGLLSDGTLETPPGAFPAGWFTGAPTPGELGPAIIVGHVRYGSPGVFARLSEMRRGDGIQVRRADGSTAGFRVTRVTNFIKSAFPTQAVYGNIPYAGLRLITCGGLDATANEFEENVVVFAELAR